MRVSLLEAAWPRLRSKFAGAGWRLRSLLSVPVAPDWDAPFLFTPLLSRCGDLAPKNWANLSARGIIDFASIAEDRLRDRAARGASVEFARPSACVATTLIAKYLTLILGGQHGAEAP
jgi:hypothetical protein